MKCNNSKFLTLENIILKIFKYIIIILESKTKIKEHKSKTILNNIINTIVFTRSLFRII